VVIAARVVQQEELKQTEGGKFSLMAGSLLRVRLLTGREAGVVPPGPALPVFVVNQAANYVLPEGTTIDPGEPLLLREVIDRDLSSYVAIPVYAE
jgi:hypothetical protein